LRGGTGFVQRTLDAADPGTAYSRELPTAQRQKTMRSSLAQWLAQGASREEALQRGHTEGGLRMTALAAELGLTVARVSQAERARETDEGARTQYLRLGPEFVHTDRPACRCHPLQSRAGGFTAQELASGDFGLTRRIYGLTLAALAAPGSLRVASNLRLARACSTTRAETGTELKTPALRPVWRVEPP